MAEVDFDSAPSSLHEKAVYILEGRTFFVEKYDHEGSPYYSTARLWDDGILDPLDTRDALGLGIAMSHNAPLPERRTGVFRM